jgi:hypothetical protein
MELSQKIREVATRPILNVDELKRNASFIILRVERVFCPHFGAYNKIISVYTKKLYYHEND